MVTPPDGLNFPEWKETDGPAPYVWSRMVAGHRCAWSCLWVARYPIGEGARVFRVDEWQGLALEEMTAQQLLLELIDVSARGMLPEWKPVPSALVFNSSTMDTEIWRNETMKLLRSARLLYGEYLATWNPPPDTAMHGRPAIRPGWEFPHGQLVDIQQEKPKDFPKGPIVGINLIPGSDNIAQPVKRGRGRPRKIW